MPTHKWGAFGSFALPLGFVVAPAIYLIGDFREAFSHAIGYGLADFLYGPLWAASLIASVMALKELVGESAPRRMSLALLAATLAALAMVMVSMMRSTNRAYFQTYTDDMNKDVYDATLRTLSMVVPGVIATGRHFLGWTLLLLGSVGWTTRQFPRVLSALYLVTGALSFFVYAFPILDGVVVPLCLIWSVWQGVWLWNFKPPLPQAL